MEREPYSCTICKQLVTPEELDDPDVPLLDAIEAAKERVCLDDWRLMAGRSREVEPGRG